MNQGTNHPIRSTGPVKIKVCDKMSSRAVRFPPRQSTQGGPFNKRVPGGIQEAEIPRDAFIKAFASRSA